MNPFNNGGAPIQDVNSILAALAAVTQQERERQQQRSLHATPQQPSDVPSHEYDPSLPRMPESGVASAVIPADRNETPLIDPSTITEWPKALRCVNQIAARDPSFQSTIRKMMANQDKHEQMWWQGRQDIFKQGGGVSLIQNLPKHLQEQVKTYDLKVYKAQKGMFNAMSLELRKLGVPFFGISPDPDLPEHAGFLATKLPQEQLVKLQRKMIEYLEDMYKD